MDTQQELRKREKEGGGGEEEKSKQKGKGSQSTPTITSSSPSPSSSPSHEFSFTISLHPSSAVPVDKSKSSPPSFAIDLSPADDIFFHGHLLPLHLLSHLPISPRSSINSFENFSLPVKDLSEDRKPITTTTTTTTTNKNNNSNTSETKGSSKAKYFSLFRLTRWRKGSEDIGKREKEEEEIKKNKRKVRLNVSHILKRYLRIIRPHLVFSEREDRQLKRKHYSFSGNLSWKEKQEWEGRRQFSAPASMWTSPTNSGLLVATPTTLPSPTNDSTMEELQSAIQAAIAHCKNSIAMKEEIKPKC